MAIVHDAARDVDVGNRIAVEQQLLMSVIEKECRNGKRTEQQGEARFVTLLLLRVARHGAMQQLGKS